MSKTMMSIRCFQRHFSSPSSHPPGPVPLPCPMETHLWYVVPQEVKSPSLLNDYMEILPPCEREHVLSFRGDELQKRALLARTLVRTTLAKYQIGSQMNPRYLRFKKNVYGKPEIDWQQAGEWSLPSLNFNLSHSSSLIACGVTVNSPIGVDVEEKERVLQMDVLSFANRFFCPCEVEHLAAVSNPEIQRYEFMKLWTLKEAYVKALGRGFSGAPFNSFALHFKPPIKSGIDLLEEGDSWVPGISVQPIDEARNLTSNWQFALLELGGTHYSAICWEKAYFHEGEQESPLNLRVWKTIPLVEDAYMSGTAEVINAGGSINHLRPA